MASPPLFWWSPEIPRENALSAFNPEPKETPPAPNAKPRRGGKTPASASSSSKKNPQRGLGVAQLERICLQERLRKVSGNIEGGEIQQFPVNLPSIYDQHPQPQHLEAATWPSRFGASGGSTAGFCYGPQCQIGSQGVSVGYGTVAAIRSMLHEQYALDRVRVGSGARLVPELPSNQRIAAAAACCVSNHHCDYCIRKLMMRENLGFSCGWNGADQDQYIMMDPQGEKSHGRSVTLREEIMEYEFFPHNSAKSDVRGGAAAAAAATESSSSQASAAANAGSDSVDLSLKLSLIS